MCGYAWVCVHERHPLFSDFYIQNCQKLTKIDGQTVETYFIIRLKDGKRSHKYGEMEKLFVSDITRL